jgi:hypothetical protein
MRFEIEGPEFVNEGDEIEIGDAIRLGDVVWFDRVEPHRVVLRLVAEHATGICYRVHRGSATDAVRLIADEQRPA